MITEKIIPLLTGGEIMDSLVEKLSASSLDFAEDYGQFEETIAYFKSCLVENLSPSVEDLIDAIRRQITSHLLFAGYLGFQANLEHFLNPVARTFMDVDPDVYLREEVAMVLPEYASAQETIDNFCKRLSPEQKEGFESVAAYIAHLETVVPKLAHYEGFMLGNELLHYVMPGYHPDVQLTIRYHAMLKEYLQF